MEEQPNYPKVAPYLVVQDGAGAIAFYIRVFGAEEVERYDYQGKVGHSTLRINGGAVMVSDEYPQHADVVGTTAPTALGGSTVSVNLSIADVDAVFTRAIEAGATALRPPRDEFYGRHATLRDPFGHVWSLVRPAKGR